VRVDSRRFPLGGSKRPESSQICTPFPPHAQTLQNQALMGGMTGDSGAIRSVTPVGRETVLPILLLDDEPLDADPGILIQTCANCGAAMDERKCKLICRCGYFLSCSDYY
jgi:hypothetical protein